jgi:hypothetical protein
LRQQELISAYLEISERIMAKTKLKLPKRIAGVKIPKSVRKGPVGQFLNSSAGQLLVAEALIAAGGAFVARHSDGAEGMTRLGRSDSDRSDNARQILERGSARLSFAFGEAMRAFREALVEGERPARDSGAKSAEVIEGEVSKKKSSQSPSSPH